MPVLAGVTFHALEGRAESVLWDLRPAYVIMVDLDLAFVRQLEVTAASASYQSVRLFQNCPHQTTALLNPLSAPCTACVTSVLLLQALILQPLGDQGSHAAAKWQYITRTQHVICDLTSRRHWFWDKQCREELHAGMPARRCTLRRRGQAR